MLKELRNVESFFDKWSPNMAYILGYFAADGCMYKNKRGAHYIAFYSNDYESITTIKDILQCSNKIEYRIRYPSKNSSYTLQIGSKKIFNHFLRLGFTPNKSLTLKPIDTLPDELFGHFLRGYFDGDGCVYFNPYIHRGKYKYRKVLNILFTSGSLSFIKALQEYLINNLKMSPGYLYFHYGAYTLRFSLNNVVKLFNFMYPSKNLPCLSRKRIKLEEGLKSFGAEV